MATLKISPRFFVCLLLLFSLSTAVYGTLLDDLRAFYPMENNADDSGINALDATERNSPTYVQGKIGDNALRCSFSSDSGLVLPFGTEWYFDEPFSINYWINSTDWGNNHAMMTADVGSATGNYFIHKPDGGRGWWQIGGVYLYTDYEQEEIHDGAWHMLTFTTAGPSVNQVKLYFDGVLVSWNASAGTLAHANPKDNFNICGDDDGGPWASIDASFDDFGFWNKTLNQSEITELYGGGDGFPYPFQLYQPALDYLNKTPLNNSNTNVPLTMNFELLEGTAPVTCNMTIDDVIIETKENVAVGTDSFSFNSTYWEEGTNKVIVYCSNEQGIDIQEKYIFVDTINPIYVDVSVRDTIDGENYLINNSNIDHNLLFNISVANTNLYDFNLSVCHSQNLSYCPYTYYNNTIGASNYVFSGSAIASLFDSFVNWSVVMNVCDSFNGTPLNCLARTDTAFINDDPINITLFSPINNVTYTTQNASVNVFFNSTTTTREGYIENCTIDFPDLGFSLLNDTITANGKNEFYADITIIPPYDTLWLYRYRYICEQPHFHNPDVVSFSSYSEYQEFQIYNNATTTTTTTTSTTTTTTGGSTTTTLEPIGVEEDTSFDEFQTIPQALFYIFITILWLVFLFATFILKGGRGKTIQLLNIFQAFLGIVLGIGLLKFNFLIGIMISLLSAGIFIGKAMYDS